MECCLRAQEGCLRGLDLSCFTVMCRFEGAVSQTLFDSTVGIVEEGQEKVAVRVLEAIFFFKYF